MKRSNIIIVMILVFTGGLFLLNTLLGQRSDRKNLGFAPDMANSFAFKTQTANSYLANGQTQQPGVNGSIAQSDTPLHFGASEDEMLRAGNELQNPMTENEVDLQRGQTVYQIFCQVCHGAGGNGDGSVVLRGFPAPPSLLLENSKNRKDGQIFHIVTFGFKNMPGYGTQINYTDRWQVVNYLRKLQESQP